MIVAVVWQFGQLDGLETQPQRQSPNDFIDDGLVIVDRLYTAK